LTRPSVDIRPVTAPLAGTVRPPGSKSLTNRALVCAALARGSSQLRGALESEDTQVMLRAWQALGVEITSGEHGTALGVVGCGGRLPSGGADLYVANSGTTARFLTAAVALGEGRFRLDGTPRMRQRPIADLVDSLRQLGVAARYLGAPGFPPLEIDARGLPGGRLRMRGDVSSQFLSGLLLAAPCARENLELTLEGPLVSRPYVDMTLAVMRAFGAEVAEPEPQRFVVSAPRGYASRDYAIEPDASAASYFWGAAAITGGQVMVSGLTTESLQGDVAFCQRLAEMGCRVVSGPEGLAVHGGPLSGIDANMNSISDTVQTLSAVALFAAGPTTIRGVAHIRHKETDRIADLATELRKLGAGVDTWDDGLRITPGRLQGAVLDTYDDHRMAMSLALVGLRVPGVVINDPGCTAKTYPGFFADLERLCAASGKPGGTGR
jgi:3-phosphoshikimate 1-carboxyvinyltransferase